VIDLRATVGPCGGPAATSPPPPPPPPPTPFEITVDVPGSHTFTGLAGYPSIQFSGQAPGAGANGAPSSATGNSSGGGGGGGGCFAKGLIPHAAYISTGRIIVTLPAGGGGGFAASLGTNGGILAINGGDPENQYIDLHGGVHGNPRTSGGASGNVANDWAWVLAVSTDGVSGNDASGGAGGTGGDSGGGDLGGDGGMVGVDGSPGNGSGAGGGGGGPGTIGTNTGGGHGAAGWCKLRWPPT